LVERNGRYVVAGITSWGYDCGSKGYPGVYARTTSQLKWIMTSIGEDYNACENEEENEEIADDDDNDDETFQNRCKRKPKL
jgi:secreted trypsin-like serine protease